MQKFLLFRMCMLPSNFCYSSAATQKVRAAFRVTTDMEMGLGSLNMQFIPEINGETLMRMRKKSSGSDDIY